VGGAPGFAVAVAFGPGDGVGLGLAEAVGTGVAMEAGVGRGVGPNVWVLVANGLAVGGLVAVEHDSASVATSRRDAVLEASTEPL
jgi:hypothetical protein